MYAQRGHLGPSFSVVEILRVLFDSILRFQPMNPGWPERDRLILSKGHAGLALYVLLADKGYFPKEILNGFTAFNGVLGVHPDYFKVPGVEASTGSLGHGPSLGVGMALAARMDKRDSRVFVVIGDGESNEGSVWEACMNAAKHRLDNFTLLVDYNKQQASGNVEMVQPLEPFADKFRSFGFETCEVDGHNPLALLDVLTRLPFKQGKPSAIVCHTIKGKGIPEAENNVDWHHQNKIDKSILERFIQILEAQRA